MSDDVVREKVRLYADEVTPVQLPPFGGVAVRRRRRRVRQVLAGTSTAIVVVLVVVLAAVLGNGGRSTTSTATPTPPAAPSGKSTPSTTLPQQSQLAGPVWRLLSVEAPGTLWHARSGSTASLTLTASQFEASDGCSTLQSAVVYDEPGLLTFGGTESSAGECSMAPPGPPEGTLSPRLFFTSLSGPMTAALSSDVLTLTQDATVLTLTRGGASYVDPSAGDTLQTLLTTHTWPLHLITSGGKTWGDPEKAVLRFGAHGYTMNPDCNEHTGAVSYAGGRLIMRAFMQTAEGCAAGELVQARSAAAIDALFTGPVEVEEDDGLLMLWDNKTSLELHQGPASTGDLGLNLPPASAAPSGAATASLQDQLIGPKWALASITSGGQTWQAPDGERFWFTFSEAGYGGQDGCNYTGGAASYSAGSIRLLPGAETAIACEGADAQRMENAFAVLLKEPVTVAMTDGTLELSAADEVVRLKPDPLWHQLGGVKWILQTWNMGKQGARLASGLRDGILFTPTSIDANDGCNDYIALATYSTQFVDLGAVTKTQAACAANPVSDAFRILFDGRFRVVIGGTQLTLTGQGVKLVFGEGPQQSYPPAIGAEPPNPSMTVPPQTPPSSS